MAGVYGIIDSQFVDVLPGIDRSYLERIEMADGTTFADLVPLINAPLAAYNSEIPPDLAEYIAPPTANVILRGRGPGAFEVNRTSEYDPARPQKPTKPFAMALAIWGNDAAMSWTEDALRAMRAEDVAAEITEALNGFRLKQRYDIIARLTDPVEVPVEDNGITTMSSPGFAGSGTGTNAFQPTLYPDLMPIPGGYTHYFACPSASIGDTLKIMRDSYRRWFPNSMYDFVGSYAMTEAIRALGDTGGFVRAERALVREPDTKAVAALDPMIYIGLFDENIRVRRPIYDFTDPNGWLFKSFGPLHPNNALVPRVDKNLGKNAYLRTRSAFPLAEAIILQRMGMNVNNRVGVMNLRVDAGGVYSPPTGFSALG